MFAKSPRAAVSRRTRQIPAEPLFLRGGRRRALLVEALDLRLLAQLCDQLGLGAAHDEGFDLVAYLLELRHRTVAPVFELDDVPAELRADRVRHLPRMH